MTRIAAALLAALCASAAHAQTRAPVTEAQAASYIRGGFLTDSAPAILSKDVKLGPELERRLNITPGAAVDSRTIYDTLITLTDPAQVNVRRATAQDLVGYFRADELREPLYVLESGSTALIIQYDLGANNIAFVGLLPLDPSAKNVAPVPALAAAAAAQKPATAAKSVAPASAPGSWARIPGVTPYRIDIQQGNNIAPEALAQLKPGLSKDQVRVLLGTPLLTSIFHSERWDYPYFREHPDGKRENRKLTVYFEDGRLSRVVGDGVLWRDKN